LVSPSAADAGQLIPFLSPWLLHGTPAVSPRVGSPLAAEFDYQAAPARLVIPCGGLNVSPVTGAT
jgi:hypothetical protein